MGCISDSTKSYVVFEESVQQTGQVYSKHGQLGLSLVFPPFDERGGILVSTKALHVGSTDRNRYCPLFPDFPPWTPQSAASTPSDPPLPILGRMLRTLRLASALAGSQVADHEGASGIQCRLLQRGAG